MTSSGFLDRSDRLNQLNHRTGKSNGSITGPVFKTLVEKRTSPAVASVYDRHFILRSLILTFTGPTSQLFGPGHRPGPHILSNRTGQKSILYVR